MYFILKLTSTKNIKLCSWVKVATLQGTFICRLKYILFFFFPETINLRQEIWSIILPIFLKIVCIFPRDRNRHLSAGSLLYIEWHRIVLFCFFKIVLSESMWPKVLILMCKVLSCRPITKFYRIYFEVDISTISVIT